jgi:hypothetical protein
VYASGGGPHHMIAVGDFNGDGRPDIAVPNEIISASSVSVLINTTPPRDLTPPTTAASALPSPNPQGWNNGDTIVRLQATDNAGGSGVKQVEYSLDGSAAVTVAGDATLIPVSAEGHHALTYFARDNAGNQELPRTFAVHIDRTAPSLTGMPQPGCAIWPANHKMVQVADVRASDLLSGIAPGSLTVTGTSSDPSDPSDPDIVIAPDGAGGFAVQVRAERLGNGTDRVYTITANAADRAGNGARATATCTVPHDQGK